MRCVDRFTELYKREPDGVAFCPYRVCPIGAHSDHQFGRVTGFAIDRGIHIAYAVKRTGIVELQSLQFEKRAQWHVASVMAEKQNDWADHLRGATLQLAKHYPLHVGLCGIIEGTLPIGGLSSSAAVILAFLSALCRVNGITLTPQEMITIAQAAENEYVGVACGKLDQSCEVYCKKDHLLYLDTLDDTYELIPTAPSMPPYRIAVFFSGVERSLAGSAFNARIDECRAAAFSLKALAGMENTKFADTALRQIPAEVFYQYKERLPTAFAKRAEHYYTEQDRVRRGAEAWRRGDLAEYGRLSFESGRSSIENWEAGSPELTTLYNCMTRTDGIYGGRFSGAGFKGCCMALIDPSYTESVTETVTREYLKEFPTLADKFSVHMCDSADGIVV